MPETLLYCVIGYALFMRAFTADIYNEHCRMDQAVMGFMAYLVMNVTFIFWWPLFWGASRISKAKARRFSAHKESARSDPTDKSLD